MLSLLPFWRASFDKHSAAAWAAGSGESPLRWADDKFTPFFLCHKSIRLRATSHTSSFDSTSQRPSLARIRHSSSFARGTIVTSGTGIIHGFRYLSPVEGIKHQPTICFLASKKFRKIKKTYARKVGIHCKRGSNSDVPNKRNCLNCSSSPSNAILKGCIFNSKKAHWLQEPTDKGRLKEVNYFMWLDKLWRFIQEIYKSCLWSRIKLKLTKTTSN